ncbi:aromatic ring-hydroxylating dioxygenase subunit alpha [Neobacillus niacini]|uniref:aromatic ring-hydroxylating oxygenase subunit alpha n=1 Tax=Neobacillus niacini TaxID=86668 RepID=UPI002FFEE6D0
MNVKTNENVSLKGEGLLETMRETIKDGLIPSKIFHDEDIYKLEKERLFSKTWNFLAHESEIPNNGDYVVRYIADDSFIVSRDNKGEIYVNLNSCSHRGMELCNVERGNSSHFRCPYHGWTFKNDGKLIGVPLEKKIYGNDSGLRQTCSLVSPQVGVYNGLIFACIDQNAESLEEYLGDFKWYLDIYTNKTSGGIEVVGAPQRWVAEANWKTGSDNFVGDVYHVQVTHRGNFEVAAKLTNTDIGSIDMHTTGGVQVTAGKGGLCLIEVPPGMVAGMPDLFHESIKENLPEQLAVLNSEQFSLKELNGTIFPNFSLLTTPSVQLPDGTIAVPHFLTLRVWRPIDSGKMEIWSWVFVDKGAPEWYKERAYKEYVTTFGPSGTFEQDDAENWQGITKIAKSSMAKDRYLNYTMGMKNNNADEIPNWPGPGKAYSSAVNEANQRNFFSLYLDYLSKK